MKKKMLGFLMVLCTMGLLGTSLASDAYYCQWVHGHYVNGRYVQGHKVCWHNHHRHCAWHNGVKHCWYN